MSYNTQNVSQTDSQNDSSNLEYVSFSPTEVCGNVYTVLDHGFVSLVDSMGTFDDIANSARISYQKHQFMDTPIRNPNEEYKINTNHPNFRLVKRLWEDEHLSPFEMCELKFHVKAPLFVVAQWVRHRTASINQISYRYTPALEEYYVPRHFNMQSSINDQSSSGTSYDPEKNVLLRDNYISILKEATKFYRNLIDMGIAREEARMILPQCLYTEFYWKINLRNLLHFLKLRCDKNAQYEIREYAQTIQLILFDLMPELKLIVNLPKW